MQILKILVSMGHPETNFPGMLRDNCIPATLTLLKSLEYFLRENKKKIPAKTMCNLSIYINIIFIVFIYQSCNKIYFSNECWDAHSLGIKAAEGGREQTSPALLPTPASPTPPCATPAAPQAARMPACPASASHPTARQAPANQPASRPAPARRPACP